MQNRYADLVEELSFEATTQYSRKGYDGVAAMLAYENLSGEEKDILRNHDKTPEHLLADVWAAVTD